MDFGKLNSKGSCNPCVCILFWSIFLLFFLPLSSFAGNATTSLQEMVVTASRLKEMKKEVSTNMRVLNEKEIQLSSAQTLGDLLAEEGTGHIHKYPGSQVTFGMRGFRGAPHGNDLKGRTLLLLNGRRAGTGNVAKIMTENVQKIEIIRGPASVQYGSAAIGGLINVITKQGEGNPGAFVQGKLGSHDYEKGNIGFSGEIKGVDFSGSFSRSRRDDYTTADGKKYFNTGFRKKEHGSLNLGYTFHPGNRIGLIYTGFNADEVGDPGRIELNDLDDYSDRNNESIDLIYDGSVENGLFSWKARYFQGYDEVTWYDPVASDPGGAMGGDDGVPETRQVDSEGAQAQFSYNPNQYQITTGLDWINYDVSSDTGGFEYNNPSFFMLAKTEFREGSVFVSAGARYDDYNVEKSQEVDKDSWTPKLGITWIPIDHLKLRTDYSEGFRMPSGDAIFGSYYYKANSGLSPEQSRNYEIGADFCYQALDTSITLFYTDFEDKIESRRIADGLQNAFINKNIGEAIHSGVEGEFSHDLAGLLHLEWSIVPYGNFVYMYQYENEETGEDLPYVSDITANWGIRALNNKGFSADLNFTYTGEQDITYPREKEKGGFTVANFSMRQKIAASENFGELTLKGEIRNLLDKKYSYVQGYPMPGRSFYLGLRYDM